MSMTPSEMAIRYEELEADYKAKKAESTKALKAFQEFVRVTIPEEMEKLGIDSAKVAGKGTLKINSIMSVKQTDKAGLTNWLHQNGFSQMATLSVNSSTLAAFVREQVEKGEEIPADFIEINSFDQASLVAR